MERSGCAIIGFHSRNHTLATFVIVIRQLISHSNFSFYKSQIYSVEWLFFTKFYKTEKNNMKSCLIHSVDHCSLIIWEQVYYMYTGIVLHVLRGSGFQEETTPVKDILGGVVRKNLYEEWDPGRDGNSGRWQTRMASECGPMRSHGHSLGWIKGNVKHDLYSLTVSRRPLPVCLQCRL